jgi:hypothetical protein
MNKAIHIVTLTVVLGMHSGSLNNQTTGKLNDHEVPLDIHLCMLQLAFTKCMRSIPRLSENKYTESGNIFSEH